MSTAVIVPLDDTRSNKFMVEAICTLRTALPWIVQHTANLRRAHRDTLIPRQLTSITQSTVNTRNQPFWSAVADQRDVRVIDDRWMAVSSDSQFCVVIALTAQLTQWQVTIAVHNYPQFSRAAPGPSFHSQLWCAGGAYFQSDEILLRDRWSTPHTHAINPQTLRERLTQKQDVDTLLAGPDVHLVWQAFRWNIRERLGMRQTRPRYTA
jgi:hypothetical protein